MEWINYADIIASVFGLACVILAGRNSKYNFWIGYLYIAALTFLFWNKNLYSALLLQPISLVINIMGHYRWTHPKEDETSSEDEKSLKVSMLSWAGRGVVVVAVLLVAGAWGWALDLIFPDDPHPYLDSCFTVLILAAQLLSAMKKWDCWIAWMIVNIAQICLHIAVGNVFMPIVSCLYLINGVWSLANWTKLYRKKA